MVCPVTLTLYSRDLHPIDAIPSVVTDQVFGTFDGQAESVQHVRRLYTRKA